MAKALAQIDGELLNGITNKLYQAFGILQLAIAAEEPGSEEGAALSAARDLVETARSQLCDEATTAEDASHG